MGRAAGAGLAADRVARDARRASRCRGWRSPGRSARAWCARSSSTAAAAAGGSALVAAYGDELAKTVAAHAPELVYEPRDAGAAGRLPQLPRGPVLARAASRARSGSSFEGEPVTLFTHAVDCRGSAEPPPGAEATTARAPAPARSTSSTGPTTRARTPGSTARAASTATTGSPSSCGSAPPAARRGRARTTATTTSAAPATGSPTPGSPTARPGGPSAARYFISGGSHAGPRRATRRALPLDARRRRPPRPPGADRRRRPRDRVRDHARRGASASGATRSTRGTD